VKAGLGRSGCQAAATIIPSTASSASKDGGKETFVVFDETHLYNAPELRRMYDTVTRNMRKRKKLAGTWYLETTTMYAPGEDSIAEKTYVEAQRIKERQPKRQRLLYDHRWGDCEDLSNLEQLALSIREAFGEAIDWNDLQGIVDGFFDTRNSTSEQRRYFLNAATESADAWFADRELAGIFEPQAQLVDRDVIALGFDGSRKRNRGVTDATALVAFRLRDRCLFEVRIWEQPDGKAGEEWEIPRIEADAEVRNAFRRFTVVAFYADPAKWEETVGTWERDLGARLKVKATREHPIQWWMTGNRNRVVVAAVKEFTDAVFERSIRLSTAAVALLRHLRNGRRRQVAQGRHDGDEGEPGLTVEDRRLHRRDARAPGRHGRAGGRREVRARARPRTPTHPLRPDRRAPRGDRHEDALLGRLVAAAAVQPAPRAAEAVRGEGPSATAASPTCPNAPRTSATCCACSRSSAAATYERIIVNAVLSEARCRRDPHRRR
jgi:hypothetical protein